MITENSQSASSLTALRQRAHQRLATQNKSIADIARANSRLLAEDTGSGCTGELILSPRDVRIEDMRFNDGTVLVFEGAGWEIGQLGQSPGTGYFNVTPRELVAYDKVSYQLFSLAVGIGGVEISFWNGTEYLGLFTARLILGANPGSSGGNGKFRYA